MKQRLAIILTSAALAVGLAAAPAGAGKTSATDAKPACVDVVNGSGTYARSVFLDVGGIVTKKNDAGRLHFNVTLGAAPCANATYRFQVWNDETQTALIWETTTPTSVSGSVLTYEVDLPLAGGVAPTNDYVCVNSITSRHNRDADRAPDPGAGSNGSGCVDVFGPPSGGSYF